MMMTILTETGKTRKELQGQMSVELRLEILITEARKPGFGWILETRPSRWSSVAFQCYLESVLDRPYVQLVGVY